MKHVVMTVLVLLILACAGGAAFLYSGIYDIAATSPHSTLFKGMVEILVERSIERHADGVQVPADFEEMAIQPGFGHYDEMCVGCHGAPGVEAREITQQMNPKPPDLAKVVGELRPAQLYWVISHGLKMTGMPGIREIDGEKERWQIAAFVHRLPELGLKGYQAMRKREEAEPGHPHHH